MFSVPPHSIEAQGFVAEESDSTVMSDEQTDGIIPTVLFTIVSRGGI